MREQKGVKVVCPTSNMDNFTNLPAMKHETCPEEQTKY
jgi:hypothetical protein